MNFIEKIFKKKTRNTEEVANFHTTIIRVENDFISSSSVMLDEMLNGNIFSLKEVKVIESAGVTGNICAESAIICGKVSGDITTLSHLEILKTAIINGDIQATSICIEAGAQINGSISIVDKIDDSELNKKLAKRIPPKAEKQEPKLASLQLPNASEPDNELVAKEVRSERVPKSTKRGPVLPHEKAAEQPEGKEKTGKLNQPSGWY